MIFLSFFLVKDLSTVFKSSTEDIIKASKLSQLTFPQEQLEVTNKNLKNDVEDADSFVPVLNKGKKVIKYPSAKKRKEDEFMSVSQVEVLSSQNVIESLEFHEKLDNIKKIPSDEKVKEWFKTTENNPFLSSSFEFTQPNSDIETLKNCVEKNETEKVGSNSSMIRIDYKKCRNEKPLNSKKNDSDPTTIDKDPYEFVPSQNKRVIKKRKKHSSCKEKAIPDFLALQKFSKENIKRNIISLNEKKEDNEKEEISSYANDFDNKDTHEKVTASQKFDMLLSETKIEESKTKNNHTLYTASQASSVKILDASYHSQMNVDTESSQDTQAFSANRVSFGLKNINKGKVKKSLKRRRSLEVQDSAEKKKKKSFDNLFNLQSQDALDLEKSVENYLLKFKGIENKKFNENISSSNSINNLINNDAPDCEKNLGKKTPLMALLHELRNDKIIYSNQNNRISFKFLYKDKDDKIRTSKQNFENHLVASLKRSHDKSVHGSEPSVSNKLTGNDYEDLTQCTDLIGFCTQEELPEEKKFREMVNKMEKELNDADLNLNEAFQVKSTKTPKKIYSESPEKIQKNFSKKENQKLNLQKTDNDINYFTSLCKRKDSTSFINFFQMSRLTPNCKRSKSSVVKLVFPIGFSSFFRKRMAQRQFSSKCLSPHSMSISRSPLLEPLPCENLCREKKILSYKASSVSNGCQTSQKCFSSVSVQTRKEPNTSVEIQTIEKPTRVAEVQTNIRGTTPEKPKEFKSIHMQTSQALFQSVEVQTSQCLPDCKNKSQKLFQRIADKTSVPSNEKDVNITSFQNRVSGTPFSHLPNPLGNSIQNEEEYSKKTIEQKHKNILNRKSIESEHSRDKNENSFDTSLSPFIVNFESDMNVSLTKKNQNNLKKAESKNEFSNEESQDFNFVSLKSLPNLQQTMSEDNFNSEKVSEGNIPNFSMPYDSVNEGRGVLTNTKNLFNKSRIDEEENLEANKTLPSKVDVSKEIIDFNDKECMQKADCMLDSKEDKDEESDCDLFVEQTPPKAVHFKPNENGLLTFRTGNADKNFTSKNKFFQHNKFPLPKEGIDNLTFHENADRSKLQNLLTKPALDKVESPIDHLKPKENDQNQLNSFAKEKLLEIINMNEDGKEGNKKLGSDNQRKMPSEEKKRFCIVASSVKSLDVIKKFANEFKLEFSSKPTKEMTHLIVGLHENDEGEILPLCTPKLLFAMANKKWIVSELWAETCLKSKAVLPEDSFETCDPIGGSGCRESRLSTHQLFNNCQIYLLGSFQSISKQELAVSI